MLIATIIVTSVANDKKKKCEDDFPKANCRENCKSDEKLDKHSKCYGDTVCCRQKIQTKKCNTVRDAVCRGNCMDNEIKNTKLECPSKKVCCIPIKPTKPPKPIKSTKPPTSTKSS